MLLSPSIKQAFAITSSLFIALFLATDVDASTVALSGLLKKATLPSFALDIQYNY